MENISRFLEFDFKHKWRSIIWDVIILSSLGILLLLISNLIRTIGIFGLKTPDFLANSPEVIRIATFFLWLILLFGLLKVGLKNRGLIKDKKYKFKQIDWPDKWIFNGNPDTTGNLDELFIKSSRAGCLLKTHLWKNFRLTFEMKFTKGLMENLGVIFRADDLDNYFMLELFRETTGSSNGKTNFRSGIKPHIRYRGGWEIFYREINNNIDFSRFVQVTLEVRGCEATFYYKQSQVFKWVLPTHVDVNHVETGFQQNRNNGNQEIIGKETTDVVQEIPFRISHGMVGFRAHPGQGTIVRNVVVESI